VRTANAYCVGRSTQYAGSKGKLAPVTTVVHPSKEAAVPAYLLRPGTTPGIALYTRCEDDLLCRAELLTLLEKTSQSSSQDQQVSGYYDMDPAYSIARFKAGLPGQGRRLPEADGPGARIIFQGGLSLSCAARRTLGQPSASDLSWCPSTARSLYTAYSEQFPLARSWSPSPDWRSNKGVLGRVASGGVELVAPKRLPFE
jgi:hypothetical protein